MIIYHNLIFPICHICTSFSFDSGAFHQQYSDMNWIFIFNINHVINKKLKFFRKFIYIFFFLEELQPMLRIIISNIIDIRELSL